MWGRVRRDVIRLENGFEQYCKSFPKSVQNDPKLSPKLVHATVLDASLEHPGHHRTFYSKTVSGNNSFWGGFGSPLGPWGSQKLPQCFLVGPFWEPFWTKNRKRGIQKGIPKLMPKKQGKCMPKGFQNYAKMETQICDCSCFLEEGESWKTVGFSNWKRGSGNAERF